MVDAKLYLDQNYPKEKRRTYLTIHLMEKELEGHLDLSDFINLEKLEKLFCYKNQLTNLDLSKNVNLSVLNCYKNQLTNLDLSKNVNLRELYCPYNQLTNINLKTNKKLENIGAFGNKINQDWKIFSHLTELKVLDLGLGIKHNGNPNDFYGSLKSLENCKNLEYLCIGRNPKITEGLEYVPSKNLYWFGCEGTVFKEILQPYAYNVEAWQKKDTRPREVLKDELLLKEVEAKFRKEKKEAIRKLEAEKNKKISELEEAQEQIKNQLTAEKTETITKLEKTIKEKDEVIKKANDNTKISNNSCEILEKRWKSAEQENEKLTSDLGKEKFNLLIESNKAKTEREKNIREKNTLETQINNLNKEKTELNTKTGETKNQLLREKAELQKGWENWAKETKEKNEIKFNNLKTKEKERLEKEQNRLINEGNVIINKKEQEIEKIKAQVASLEQTKKQLERQKKETEEALNQKEQCRKEWMDYAKQLENKELEIKNRIDKVLNRSRMFNKSSKNLGEAVDEINTLVIGQEHQIKTTSDKCLSVVTAPFRWVSGKIGTGFALAGFMTVLPTLIGGLGWLLKSWLTVKTGGVAGAFTVANSMMNQKPNNISPPHGEMNYLPPQQNNYLPPQQPNANLPPVINNHYHTLATEKGKRKSTNNKKKVKGDSS